MKRNTRASKLATLGLLAFALATAAGMVHTFSPVQESVKADLRLSDFALSLVQGMGAALPIALLSIPFGQLVDRGNRSRLLILLALGWTGGTVATALATGFYSLLAARMLVTVAAACSVPAVISLAADLISPARRGGAMLVLTFGRIVGGAVAFIVSGWLFGVLTAAARPAAGAWRGEHLAMAGIGLVLIGPLLFLREPVRREVASVAVGSMRTALAALWERRAFLLPLFIGQTGVVMADAAAGIWAAPVLVRDYGLRPEQFSLWMGLVLLVAGIAGAVLGGLGADAGQRTARRAGRRGGVLFASVAASAVAIPAALFPLMPGPASFGVLLGLLLLTGTIAGVGTVTAISVDVPNELRGIAIGAFNAFAGLLGIGVAPTLVTGVSHLLGGETYLAGALAIVGVSTQVLSLTGFGLAVGVSRSRPAGTAQLAIKSV